MVFEEALVDRTEVPFGQVAVVYELPVDTGEPIYGPLEVSVADGVTFEESVALRVEEAAVEGRYLQGRAALGDDPKQFHQARPERRAPREEGTSALQVALHVVLYGVEAIGVAVVCGLVDREEVARFGVEDEQEPVEQDQGCRRSHGAYQAQPKAGSSDGPETPAPGA